MPREILLPSLSAGMEEATLARWLKREGDRVESGDVIAEIETDKATMEFQTEVEGIIGTILVPAGTQGVKVNQPIALILGEGEQRDAIRSAALLQNSTSTLAVAVQISPHEPVDPAMPVLPPELANDKNVSGRVSASPLARRLARDTGVDLSGLIGSGPHGRIVRLDVERARGGGVARVTPVEARPGAADAPTAAPSYREIPLTNVRKVMARRLTESKQTVPHFYLTIDCCIDKLLALRAEVNAHLNRQQIDAKVSVNDFVIRAVALALRKVPGANASFTETAIREYTDVDISVAVATPNGLFTPIVRSADQKNLVAISTEMKGLAGRARDGKLRPEEYQGGGFSISNLGMYGIKQFEAIINPPQGCILAVGAGEQRPVVKGNAVAIATQMSCTLSVDHRVVDGALGAEFLQAFKLLIEEPFVLLL